MLGALLAAACGDDVVTTSLGTDTEGPSTSDATDPPLPTTTNPSTDPTTTNATTTPVPTTTDAPTTDTTSPITMTTVDTDANTGTTDATGATDSNTGTGTSTGTDTDTDTGPDTDTGGQASGRTLSQTVNGGTKASSASFTMVFTVGQPTSNQGVYTSASFRLQGGLIGANGNPP